MRVIVVISGILAFLLTFHLWLVINDNLYFYNVIDKTLLKGKLGPSIDEFEEFANDTIDPGLPQPWEKSTKYNKLKLPGKSTGELMKYESTAFLVIHRDSILHEAYWDGYDSLAQSNSFSMAKSFVSMLVGIALQKGAIGSIDDPVEKYLPHYATSVGTPITIKHLLMMSSGIGFDENYLNPFAFPAKANYGKNLATLVKQYPVIDTPGVFYDYQSGNTQLLSFIVEAATGTTSSEYLEEGFWKPAGATSAAYWSLDHEGGNEKAFCCINATARDFARIGKLYMQGGMWDSVQVVPNWYVKKSTSPNGLPDKRDGESVHFYGYQWWMGTHREIDFFYARGILGQYVFCVPGKQLIVVRLGHHRSSIRADNHPVDIFSWLDAGLELLEQKQNN